MKKDNIIIGYVLSDLQGLHACCGPACIVFGNENVANEHKAARPWLSTSSAEPAGLDEIMLGMMAGGAYGFDSVAAKAWNDALISHKSYYADYEKKLGFCPPQIKLPRAGEFEAIGWAADPAIHRSVQRFLMAEKQRDLSSN